jgi:hypothetical protein
MTHEFKDGDRVRLEGVVVGLGSMVANVRLNGDDDLKHNMIHHKAMAHATLIHKATHTAPCKGTNCSMNGMNGLDHSPECNAEHAAAIAGGKFVKQEAKAPSILDTSKPMRIVPSGVDARYIGTMSNGRIVCEFRSDAFVFCSDFRERELENIPTPKRTDSMKLIALHSTWAGAPKPVGVYYDNDVPQSSEVLGRAVVTYTEGEGWSVEGVQP